MSSTSTPLKCFNLLILLLAFVYPIYTSNIFSTPPLAQLSHHNQKTLQEQNTMSKSSSEGVVGKRRNAIFILDFDSTITTSDTISPLFSAAVTFHSQHNPNSDMDASLQWILEEYSKDLKSQTPPPSAGFNNIQDFVEYQRSLKGVEERSFARVSQTGILGGIGEEGWRALGREAREEGNVTLREGWREFEEVVSGKWGVVSVNFCEAWVRGVLGLDVGDGEVVEVLANEPNWEGVLSVGNGNEGEVMCDSEGKRNAMRGLIKKMGGEEERVVVYIGDSATDVECLLDERVVGIVMTKVDGKSVLLDSLRKFGDAKRVNEFDNDGSKDRALVYFARDFKEILESPFFTDES